MANRDVGSHTNPIAVLRIHDLVVARTARDAIDQRELRGELWECLRAAEPNEFRDRVQEDRQQFLRVLMHTVFERRLQIAESDEELPSCSTTGAPKRVQHRKQFRNEHHALSSNLQRMW